MDANAKWAWAGKPAVLAEARERALAARRLLLDNIDPIEQRKAQRTARLLEDAKRTSFIDAAEAYIKTKSPEWRNAKHDAQWRATLKTYAYPIIGALPIDSIDTELVRKVLDPIWKAKPKPPIACAVALSRFWILPA